MLNKKKFIIEKMNKNRNVNSKNQYEKKVIIFIINFPKRKHLIMTEIS